MSYVEQSLTPGEQILYETGLHWIVLFWPVFCAALFALPGLFLLLGSIFNMKDPDARAMAIASPFWFVVAGLFLLFGNLRWKATEIAVTNTRIVIKTGLPHRKTFELLFSKVESIGVEEDSMGRWLGYGLVVVKSTGGMPEHFDDYSTVFRWNLEALEALELKEGEKVTITVVSSGSKAGPDCLERAAGGMGGFGRCRPTKARHL